MRATTTPPVSVVVTARSAPLIVSTLTVPMMRSAFATHSASSGAAQKPSVAHIAPRPQSASAAHGTRTQTESSHTSPAPQFSSVSHGVGGTGVQTDPSHVSPVPQSSSSSHGVGAWRQTKSSHVKSLPHPKSGEHVSPTLAGCVPAVHTPMWQSAATRPLKSHSRLTHSAPLRQLEPSRPSVAKRRRRVDAGGTAPSGAPSAFSSSRSK
mmetsp:Transcript_15590/g.54144  ORF Transcript_15590/g.54144 Transcript_15590/m.54144 type:complete len:209 (+) Transcript_15590:288-914(+)